MKPRIVFLDIDGVLNSSQWWRDKDSVPWVDCQIDPRAVDLLNRIAPPETTRIVVSSAWRLMGRQSVTDVLRRVGVKARVVGVTPDLVRLGDCRRGTEIATWLAEHGERISAYVVIDDDHDAGIGHERVFIKTDFAWGLTEEHVTMAREMFESVEKALCGEVVRDG